MEIKFPQQEDSFRKTLMQAILACIAALAIGLFLGNALGTVFGTDDSVLSTNTYTENMAAVKTLFTDPDQFDSYMQTAMVFREMEGLTLLSSKSGEIMMGTYQGEENSSEEMFSGEIRRSLKEMMHTEEALWGVTNTAGDPIEGIYLRNIAVRDGVVFYYLYYDQYGYIGLAYDHSRSLTEKMPSTAMALAQDTNTDQGMWYLTYYLED